MQLVLCIVGENVTLKLAFSAKFNKIQNLKKKLTQKNNINCI